MVEAAKQWMLVVSGLSLCLCCGVLSFDVPDVMVGQLVFAWKAMSLLFRNHSILTHSSCVCFLSNLQHAWLHSGWRHSAAQFVGEHHFFDLPDPLHASPLRAGALFADDASPGDRPGCSSRHLRHWSVGAVASGRVRCVRNQSIH